MSTTCMNPTELNIGFCVTDNVNGICFHSKRFMITEVDKIHTEKTIFV